MWSTIGPQYAASSPETSFPSTRSCRMKNGHFRQICRPCNSGCFGLLAYGAMIGSCVYRHTCCKPQICSRDAPRMLDLQPDPCFKEELYVDSFSFFSPLPRLLHLEGVSPFLFLLLHSPSLILDLLLLVDSRLSVVTTSRSAAFSFSTSIPILTTR